MRRLLGLKHKTKPYAGELRSCVVRAAGRRCARASKVPKQPRRQTGVAREREGGGQYGGALPEAGLRSKEWATRVVAVPWGSDRPNKTQRTQRSRESKGKARRKRRENKTRRRRKGKRVEARHGKVEEKTQLDAVVGMTWE